MNNTFRFILRTFVLLLAWQNTMGQAATSKISLYTSFNGRHQERSGYRVYINDRLATSANVNEVVTIELISTGRFSIRLQDAYYPQSLTVDLNSGDNVIIARNLNSIKGNVNKWHVSTPEEWRELVLSASGATLKVQEDPQNPWGEVSASSKQTKGQGTCFLLSSDGYLITNYHVIENAKEITVKGIDGDFTTKYGATLVASDQSNDLALIKLGNKNLKFETPPFGIRSNGVSTAEKIYALGFPDVEVLGEEAKVTEGIISAKSGAQGDVGKFQISAAVNPGNSGGPLIDEQGNLVGVVFAKSTIAESTGYAIKSGNLEAFLHNVDGFIFPNWVNTMADKSVVEKVAKWKTYVFIVETN